MGGNWYEKCVPAHLYVEGDPVEFRGDLWRHKTRVPGLSFGVVCVILRLAILVEHQQTDTDTGRWLQYRGCIASSGKNYTCTSLTFVSYSDIIAENLSLFEQLTARFCVSCDCV